MPFTIFPNPHNFKISLPDVREQHSLIETLNHRVGKKLEMKAPVTNLGGKLLELIKRNHNDIGAGLERIVFFFSSSFGVKW